MRFATSLFLALFTASFRHVAQALSPVGVTEVHGGVMLTPIEGLGHYSGPAACSGFAEEARVCAIRGVCRWYTCASPGSCTTDATCIRLPGATRAGTAACLAQCTQLGRIGGESTNELCAGFGSLAPSCALCLKRDRTLQHSLNPPSSSPCVCVCVCVCQAALMTRQRVLAVSSSAPSAASLKPTAARGAPTKPSLACRRSAWARDAPAASCGLSQCSSRGAAAT